MHITQEEASSCVSFHAKFDSWVRGQLAMYERATIKAAEYSRKQREEQARSMEEAAVKDTTKQVAYILSHPKWNGVESFEYTPRKNRKLPGCEIRLRSAWPVKEKRNALYPQLAVDIGDRRPVIITLFDRKGWHIREIKQEGCVSAIEIAKNNSTS